jgi:DNA-binding protein
MRVIDIILEMAADAVDNLKSVLADKIRTLPADSQSIKTLREIEDLLRDVNAGGFKGLIKKDLQSIDDPAVTQNQKTLAMYINSVDGDPEQRKELFDMWRADRIVNKDALFSGDDVTFDEIFNGYNSNPFITELVNTLMTISSNGHGKGEFALSVFSKDINKPAGGKGDLIAHYKNKLLHVEVKTADRTTTIDPETGKEKTSDSSARFGDQEVGVSEEWVEHAKDLNNYVRGIGEYSKRQGKKMEVPANGINISKAIDVYRSLDIAPKEQKVYVNKLENVVKAIFGRVGKVQRSKYLKSLATNIDGILDGIVSGSYNMAKQSYVNASFNYYMAKKEDDGVLFLNLIDGTAVWYDSAEALRSKGLRLDATTIYLTGTSDPTRSAYPQVYIVPTTQGGDAAQKKLKKITKGKDPFKDPQFVQHLTDVVSKLLYDRNVTNPNIGAKILNYTAMLIASSTVTTDQIIPELEAKFPQLRIPVARTVTLKQQAAQQQSAQQQSATASAQAAQAQNQAQFQQPATATQPV